MNYREIFDSKVEQIVESSNKYFDDATSFCSSIKVDELDDLAKFGELYKKLDLHTRTVQGLVVSFNLDSIKKIIDIEYGAKLKCAEGRKNELILSIRKKVEDKVREKTEEIKRINDGIRQRNKALRDEIDAVNSKYRQLEVKRQRLLEYSADILQLCNNYGIRVSDINIDNSMFSIDELGVLYDQFYAFISSRSVKSNPIRWIREVTNNDSIALLGILFLFLVLSISPIFNFLMVAVLLYIFYNASIQDSLVKRYTILAGLTFNTNPMEFGITKELSEGDIERELSEDIDPDDDPDFADLLREAESSMSDDKEEDDIKFSMSKDIANFTRDYSSMESELKGVIDTINSYKDDTLRVLSSKLDDLKKREQELKSNIKLLGEEFSESYVLDTNIKLGFDEDTYIYEKVDLGYKNTVISSNNSEEDIDTFLKVIITNYLCNVRPGYIDVTIYDPNGLGRSMAGFYDAEVDNIFTIAESDLNKIILSMKKHTDKVIRMTKGKTISEYNEDASKVGKTCLTYKVLVIMSQPKSIEENEELMSFMEYSANLGVFVIIVSNKKFANTNFFTKPFDGISKPINIDRFQFPVKVMQNFIKAYNSLKSPALSWSEYKERVIPKNKIWTYSADERIDLDPGFENGDPSKFKGYSVGNTGDIHVIVVGGTGAGKSVFINHIIMEICFKYSPDEVELSLVDFKGSEFNFYLPNKAQGVTKMLPHITDCLCTSDPSYSVSLFSKFRADSDVRYKRLMDAGYKNMMEYNRAMVKQGHPENRMKRKLVIVDEFQVIFEKTNTKQQEQLKKDITQISKVARACGIHLMFCSQSMKGTISDDILNQFTLRFGLRCNMDVSKAIMGTTFSGDIRERNGYLYVSSVDDRSKELQKRYRAPFISGTEQRKDIEYIYDLAEEKGLLPKVPPVTYDETTKHYLPEVDELFDKLHKNNQNTNNLFILGERMVYSDKGRRSNIILGRENNQHIFSVFQDSNDIVMFFNTIMECLKFNGDHQLIINSQVQDMSYICCADRYIDDTNRAFYNPDVKPQNMFEFLNSILESRKKSSDYDSLKPLYVILFGYNKSVGFGIESNYKLIDKFGLLLQTCGVCNMHIIFICDDLNEIPKAITTACAHRICGRTTEKASMSLMGTDIASKTYSEDNGYMFLNSYERVERLKIYRSDVERKIKERSLIV